MSRTLTPALLIGALFVAPALAAEPPTLEALAMRPIVRDIDLSPSGKHIAVHRLRGRGEKYGVFVYETEKLDAKPYVLASEHADITGFDWANNERLLISTRQLVEVPGNRAGYNNPGIGAPGKVKTYAFKLLSVGLDGGRWIELPRKKEITRFASETFAARLNSPEVVSRLPDEKDWVLIEWRNAGSGSELFKVNIKNGRLKSVFKQSDRFSGYEVDEDQEVRIRESYNKDDTVTLWFRLKGSKEWKEWITWDVVTRRSIEFLSFFREAGEDVFNKVLALASHERDTEGVFLYDLEDLTKPPELLFGVERFDASGVLLRDTDGDEVSDVVGFTYTGDGPTLYYIDAAEAALQKSIDAALPPQHYNRIIDRAADDKYIVIRSQAAREPGRYYLLTTGDDGAKSLALLGASTLFGPEQLGEQRAFWYTARDGMKLHAILTLPTSGEPPYPLVAHPHGGPWSRDSLHWVSEFWDEWPQVLATRGYAVLQPNFRGSTGFGAAYRDAGDKEWGYKMQDDVDDGALHLVKEGLADPARLAIFGWSYGGYSAMVGALRNPNIYRCAIPGAGVASMELIIKERKDNRATEVFQGPSVAGLSPIKEAQKVNVPVLLVHGDADLIVDVKHSDMFARALEKHAKPHRYLRLTGAAHRVDTLGYEHNLEFYGELLNFLATDCNLPTPTNPTSR